MAKKPPKNRMASRLRPIYQATQIKPWREYRKMSQEVLADKVGEYLLERGIRDDGYTHASIGRLENGKMPYKQPVLEAIADALGVTVEILIALPPPPDDPDSPDPTAEQRRLWEAATAEQKQTYLGILRTITRKTGTEG